MARTKINKMELMREALAALGNEATAARLVAYFAEKGATISPEMASNYKSNIIRGKKKKLAAASVNGTAHPEHPSAPDGGKRPKTFSSTAFTADDIKDARTFIEMVGPDKAKELVGILS